MSLFDYKIATQLKDWDTPFYALIMAAMWRGDTDNVQRLRAAFPDVWDELNARYNAPGGRIDSDPPVDDNDDLEIAVGDP